MFVQICGLILLISFFVIFGVIFLLPICLSKQQLIQFLNKVGFMPGLSLAESKETTIEELEEWDATFIQNFEDDDILYAIENPEKIGLTDHKYLLYLLEKEYRNLEE